jgi:hypothetical protein
LPKPTPKPSKPPIECAVNKGLILDLSGVSTKKPVVTSANKRISAEISNSTIVKGSLTKCANVLTIKIRKVTK